MTLNETGIAALPPFQILCTAFSAARWVDVTAFEHAEKEGWPRCCERPARCFVFGCRGVSLSS